MNIFNVQTLSAPKVFKPSVRFDPLYKPPNGALASLEEEQVLLSENNFLKLSILAAELEIPSSESQWYYLALKLAGMFYKQTKRRGAKKKRSEENDELLVAAVKKQKKQNPKFPVSKICRILVEDPIWRDQISHESKDPTEALRRRYYSATKKKVVK